MCVQLDLQDVFLREVIPSSTRTHARAHRLTIQGYVVNATHVTVQYVWYAERRSVSAQQQGLSFNFCLSCAPWQPDCPGLPSAVSLSESLFRNVGVWPAPPSPSGSRAHSFPHAARAGRGLMLTASHVYSHKVSGRFPPGAKGGK